MPRGGVLEVDVVPQAQYRPDGRGSGWRCASWTAGPGITLDMAPRLFQPFVSSKETGLGLGPGYFPGALPRATAGGPGGRQPPRRRSPFHSAVASGGPPRELLTCLTRDGAVCRASWSSTTKPRSCTLSSEPFEASRILQGAHGLPRPAKGSNCSNKAKPHVVVLDIYLPDRSGHWRLSTNSRTTMPGTPRWIFITGHRQTRRHGHRSHRSLERSTTCSKPLELGGRSAANAVAAGRLQIRPLFAYAGGAFRKSTKLARSGRRASSVRCPAMQVCLQGPIGRVCHFRDVTVLLLGESGNRQRTGGAGPSINTAGRSTGPFPGHQLCRPSPDKPCWKASSLRPRKGCFYRRPTRKRIGKFEQCSGGTPFLV